MKNTTIMHKVGIKILTMEQLKAALPDQQLLREKIEKVRKVAKTTNSGKGRNKSKYLLYNLIYDNLFSIVGDRGTGKTSVLFTLYNSIFKSAEKAVYDICVPMIIPEMLNSNDTLIGWILTALETVISDIESQIKNLQNEPKSHSTYIMNLFFKNCVYNTDNKLTRGYRELRQEYMSIRHQHNNGRYSHEEKIQIEQDRIQNSYGFLFKLRDFWDLLIDVKRELNKIMNRKDDTNDADEAEEPLIYIFIDDVDLAPRIINELLYLMPKYLSHPNVVVIVSLSPSIMKLAVDHSLYKDITGQSLNMFEYPVREDSIFKDNNAFFDEIVDYQHKHLDHAKAVNPYKCISKLSNDILLKTFAPSVRFHLKEYNNLDQKAEFLRNHLKEKHPELSKSKMTFFEYCIYEISELSPKLYKKGKTKVWNKDKEAKVKCMTKNSPILYYSFLGTTAREIANVCTALEDMVKKLENIDVTVVQNTEDTIYDILFEFLSVVIDSNPRYRCLINKRHKLLMNSYNEWGLYVNYQELNDIFCESDHIEMNKRKRLNDFISMYAMLNFIERIIYILKPNRMHTHGYEQFFELLFVICRCQYIIPQDDDLEESFKKLEVFYDKDIIQKFNLDDMTHQNIFLRAAFPPERFGDNANVSDCRKAIRKYIIDDSRWGSLLCMIMYKRFSGVWLFKGIHMEDHLLDENKISNKYLVAANNALIESASNIISNNAYYFEFSDNEEDINSIIYDRDDFDILINDVYGKCAKIAENNFGLIMISDVATNLNESLDGISNWLIESWIALKGVANLDYKNLFSNISNSINAFNSDGYMGYLGDEKLVVINEMDEFVKITSVLGSTSLRIERRLNTLLKEKAECSKNYNSWCDECINQQNILLRQTESEEERLSIKNKIDSYSKRKDSLVPFEKIEKFVGETERILRALEHGTSHRIAHRRQGLNDLKDLCEIAFTCERYTIEIAVEYLLDLSAIEYIYEKYLRALLMDAAENSAMKRSKWNNPPLDDVYAVLVRDSHLQEIDTNIFRRSVANAQDEAVETMLSGERNV